MKIKEVIVVEGKHDSAVLKQYFDCDTIETQGSAINQEIIEQIKLAQAKRGVIIFTDPDYPGLRIRNIINQEIPNAYNAFVSRDKASNGKKLGVAETPIEEIVRALENARVFSLEKEEKLYTLSDLYELGLVGQINSSFLREKVYKRYNLGYGNAKTLIKRLSSLGINKDELKEYLKEIINENSK